MQQKPNKFTRKTAHKIRALEGFYCAHAWLGLQDVIRNPAKYEEDMKNVLYIAYRLGITEA